MKTTNRRMRGAAACMIGALAVFIPACSDESAATDCDDDVTTEGEPMRLNQNEPTQIGDARYVVANIGPVDADGESKQGAQLDTLDGQGTSVDFVDCDVVEIDGTQYRARVEATSVSFERLAGE